MRLFFIFLLFPLISGDILPQLQYLDFFKASELIYDEILNEERSSSFSEQCLSDVVQYLGGLRNQSWAQKMFDSSAKIPEGVLNGNFIFLGQFDECLKIDGPDETFKGQHCMMDVALNTNDATLSKIKLFYGVCLPSSCNSTDVEFIYNFLSQNYLHSFFNISIIPDNCRTRDGGQPLRAGDWAFAGVLIFFLVIAICSTGYDLYEHKVKKNKKPHPLLSSFSWYTNGKTLLEINKSSNQMLALYGLRAISMGWVILGHTYLNSAISPIANILVIPDMAEDISHAVIFNSFVSVDTFFLLSGLLVCFVFFRSMQSKRTFDAPVSYLHRYIRLTPPYAIVILFQICLIQHLGDGPMWYRIFHKACEKCEKYWWTGLLYVQNYANPLNMCLEQSWYLSADTQMFWLSPILLYPMYFWPAIGASLLFLALMATTWTTFAVTYVYDLPANIVTQQNDDRLIMDYFPTHTRATPYIIGMALGYLICGMKAKKIKLELNGVMITIGWILSTVFMVGSFNSMTYFTQKNPDYTKLESAFYLSLHRVGWGLGLAWIIFACVNGFGGIVNAILSFKILQPLAKLSYGAYLTHYSLQRVRIGLLRTNVYGSDFDIVYYFIADFILSFLLAIPLYLVFEQPFLHLDRYFLGKAKILQYPNPKRPQRQRRDEEKGEENVEEKGKEKEDVAQDSEIKASTSEEKKTTEL